MRKIREWWNQEILVQVKHMFTAIAFVLFTLTGFWYQDTHTDRAQCLTRVQIRGDLRSVLFKIIDLSDVLPGDQGAEAYRLNRTNFINEKYPALDERMC